MAGLKVFVSSTCYDLSILRSQLRLFIQNIGHEPTMSDYNDLLYDPRVHTHTSCVDEVASCDAVVLIVGSRFGGKSVPEALSKLDFDRLFNESKSIESLKVKENLSVTQLEILKAVESDIPVFTFIDEGVWHDHALYEKNKDKAIISDIDFPSIQKPETARFIFEFINFIRHRVRGNSVFPFSKLQDIEDILRRQWSALFQKLLLEQRSKAYAARRLDDLSEQFEDLKTAILSSIRNDKQREVARGVVRYRRLVTFLRNLGRFDFGLVTAGHASWTDVLNSADIKKVFNPLDLPDNISSRGSYRNRIFLIKEDNTFFELRAPQDYMIELEADWAGFVMLSDDTRSIIWEALDDIPSGTLLQYVPSDFYVYINKLIAEVGSVNMMPIPGRAPGK